METPLSPDFPRLTTARLILRELLPGDAADVLVFRGDPIVQKYDDAPIQSLQEARDFIEEMRGMDAAGDQLTWAVVLPSDNRVIGLVGLQLVNHAGDKYHRRAEIGYGIAKSAWGKGIGSEAVEAAVRYAFEQRGLQRIYANTAAENIRSIAMLERLGFVREGTRRQCILEDDGLFYDSALYALIRSDRGYPPLW